MELTALSSNEYLVDAASRRAILVQRYAAGVEKVAAADVKHILNEIVALLDEKYFQDISGARFGSLQMDVSALYSEEYKHLGDKILNELLAFAENEGEFSAEMFTEATKAEIAKPSTENLRLALMSHPMQVDNPISINSALAQYGQKKAYQVTQTVKDGFTKGLTSQELIKSVKSLIPLQSTQAGALVRTATNAVSSSARMETMLENKDIFEGYEWVATLDSRTSLVCMGRDGNIYEFNQNNPLPPAHWGCRSTVIPKIDPRYDLAASVDGVRPSSGDKREQVSAKTTYSGWLRKQSAGFQDEVLGPARAKLLRSGGLSLDKFVDPSGRTYTLDQLRSLNPLAFEKANL